MWTALLVACTPAPVFVEPPGAPVGDPFSVPSLAGCTYTLDANFDTLTWEYDARGHLITDEVEDNRVANYTWQGDCLSQMTVTYPDGVPTAGDAEYGGGYSNQQAQEVNNFTCDHGHWTGWERSLLDQQGYPRAAEFYRYENTYDSSERLSEVQVWLEGNGSADTQIVVASYLWYDDERPLSVVFQQPNDKGTNTTTWVWDHDRLLGWDLRGSGSERTMERVWKKDQLSEEIYTEEEVEGLTFSYSYDDTKAPFPSEVSVTSDPWLSGLEIGVSLPRPLTALEDIGGLPASSDISVKCKASE